MSWTAGLYSRAVTNQLCVSEPLVTGPRATWRPCFPISTVGIKSFACVDENKTRREACGNNVPFFRGSIDRGNNVPVFRGEGV